MGGGEFGYQPTGGSMVWLQPTSWVAGDTHTIITIQHQTHPHKNAAYPPLFRPIAQICPLHTLRIVLCTHSRASILTPSSRSPQNGATPLFLASQEGHSSVVERLIMATNDVDSTTKVRADAGLSCCVGEEHGGTACRTAPSPSRERTSCTVTLRGACGVTH
jgi:hypothetical protein